MRKCAPLRAQQVAARHSDGLQRQQGLEADGRRSICRQPNQVGRQGSSQLSRAAACGSGRCCTQACHGGSPGCLSVRAANLAGRQAAETAMHILRQKNNNFA